MVLRNEVAYKLTPEIIESLIEYHKDIHCVNAKANIHDWSEKEQQCEKLHENFVQAINKFVFRTEVSALQGLEEDAAKELLRGKNEEVKNSIMGLLKPLLPPPLRIVRDPPLLPSSRAAADLWSQPSPLRTMPAPVESWKILPSSLSVASTADSAASIWAAIGMSEVQLPSPPSAFSQPYSTAGLYFSSPVVTVTIPHYRYPVYDTVV